MKKLPCIILLTCCAAVSVRNSDVAALNDLQHRADESVKSGNNEGYVALLTDDAVLMPPNGPALVGKEKIRIWGQRFSEEFTIDSYESADQELIIAGDWAFRRSNIRWAVRPKAGGNAIPSEGKYIIIYRRQPNGSWKIARDIFNFNGSN